MIVTPRAIDGAEKSLKLSATLAVVVGLALCGFVLWFCVTRGVYLDQLAHQQHPIEQDQKLVRGVKALVYFGFSGTAFILVVLGAQVLRLLRMRSGLRANYGPNQAEKNEV